MTSRQTIVVPISDLIPDPDQPRRHFDEESLHGLAQTLRVEQLHPVLAYRHQGQLVILDGERRWRAGQLAGLKTLQVLEVPLPSESKRIERSLIANLQRVDLSPIEKADAIALLIDSSGWTATKAATALGLSPATISRLLALRELPEPVREQIARGELSASAGYAIVRAEDGVDKTELAKEAVENKLSREATATKAKRAGKDKSKTNTKTAPVRVTAKLGAGKSITVMAPALDSVEALIAQLEELLGKARKARPRGVTLSTFVALLRDEAKKTTAKPGKAEGA